MERRALPGVVAFLPLTIAGFVTGALGAVGVGATALTVAFYGIYAAALVGQSQLIAGALSPKPKKFSPVPSPMNLAIQVAPSRKWGYGQCAVGGDIVYWFLDGTNNANLWLVVAIHDTPIQSIESFICENTVISFTANAATNKYIKSGAAKMFRYDKLGAESQTVETNLDAASADWTSNHRLRGVAYYVMKLIHEPDIFPVGMPSPITVIKGRKLWDPRLDNNYGGSGSHDINNEATWEWSANAALCLLDYLIGPKIAGKRIGGCGIPIGAIDHLSFAAAATICDENVSLAAGGSEDRYTCHGFVDALEDKESVVESMLLAMHGTLVMRGGKLYLIAGAAQTAVMSLTDDDLAGSLTINPSSSRQEKVNKLTCVFADPNQNYAAVPGPPFTVAQYVTDDGGITLEREIQHRFTTSSTTVNRLNKLILSGFREQLSIDVVFKPKAVEISAGDTFNWSSALAGYASTKMICLARELMPDGAVHIVARQETDAKYSWATSEEQAPPSFATGPGADTPPAPATVTGLAVAQVGSTVRLSWNELTGNPHLAGYDILYGVQGGSIGTATLISQQSRVTSFTTNAIAPGAWKFYVRARDTFGQTGTADDENFTVVATADQPVNLGDLLVTLVGLSNVKLALDAGYISSVASATTQSWADLISSPDDHFTRGGTAGSDSGEPTFRGTAGGLSGNEYWLGAGGTNDYFIYTGGGNPSWIQPFHQNNAVLTIGALIYIPDFIDHTGREFVALTNYGSTDDTGFRFWIDEENLTIHFRVLNNNATVIDVSTGLDNTWYGNWMFVGVSLDESVGAGGGKFMVNGQELATFTSTYSSPSAGNAEASLSIASYHDERLNAGDRIAMLFALDAAMTTANWIALYNMIRNSRPGYRLP